MRYLRFLVLTILVVILPLAVHARPLSTLRVTSSGHGIVLSTTLSRRSYPSDALVNVHLSVRNVSKRAVYLSHLCGQENPLAQVRAGNGRVVYPPALAAPVPPVKSCKLPRPTALRPGRSLTWQYFVLLRGRHLRVSVALGRHGKVGSMLAAVSSPFTVQLTSVDAPVITITSSPTISAQVTPTGATRGPLYYADWYRCTAGGNAEERYWLPADSNSIVPPCAQPVEWHLLAGWLDHSVGCADYVRSASGGHPPTMTPTVIPTVTPTVTSTSRYLGSRLTSRLKPSNQNSGPLTRHRHPPEPAEATPIPESAPACPSP